MTATGRDRLAGFAAEDRLLLECSRVVIDARAAERVAGILSGRVDWEAVLEASIRHGVAPLLKHGLAQVEALADARVPDEVAEVLGVLHANSAQRNRRLFTALGEVTAAMRAGGAEPVGLKDVQLAVDVYPDPALRPIGDIDLLIRHEGWDAAASSLAALGFVPRPSADVPYARAYAQAQHFRRASDEIWIDLQWNVMEREWDRNGEGRFTYDGLGMWERAVPMSYDNYELRVPTREDMLFHLCLHLEGHMYSELVLFCDIAELLRHKGHELRWDRLLEVARSYRAESSVYYVLWLTERLLGVSAPAWVLEELKPPYFHGGLLAPVYGNLTPLHLSLDEIRLAVAPPPPLLRELERVSRRQTARALRLERELDELSTIFISRGGRLIVFDGMASPRLFPDSSLPAFEPLHAYVLAEDEHLLAPYLDSVRSLPIATRDPVLAGEHFKLTFVCERSSQLWPPPSSTEEGLTNAGSAFRSLSSRIMRSRVDDRDATARLIVHPLSAEELIVALAAKVGSAGEHWLFQLCGLLELLRGLDGRVDSARIAELASGLDEQGPVSGSLSIVSGLIDEEVPASPLAREEIDPPRVLQWARYGPSSLRRYPWLRSAYYFTFAMLATPGVRPRLRYLRRSMHGGDGGGALPALVRGMITGAVGSRPASAALPYELVHWLEPETASLLERRHRSGVGCS